MPKNPSIYEQEVAQGLKERHIQFEQEFRFKKDRRWRFDFVLKPVKVKIAIEINGGSWIGGRHSKGLQYEKDLEKLNAAQLDGWIVLQYVPNSIPKLWENLKELKIIK